MTGSTDVVTIYLVRHGKASAGFDRHLDPGLDAVGREQAETTANWLVGLGRMPIYSSPMARARETAQALARRWNIEPLIEPRVSEIPSPTSDLAERAEWLRDVMADRWSNLDADLHRWRRDMIDCVTAYKQDCVVFCHYIAINVIVTAATGADELITFHPDNASVTKVALGDGKLQLIELGRQAQTKIN